MKIVCILYNIQRYTYVSFLKKRPVLCAFKAILTHRRIHET